MAMTPHRKTLSGRHAFALAQEVAARDGTLALKVRGFSMEPVIRDGERVTLGPCLRPKVGDVVLYRCGDRIGLHQVRAVEGDRLLVAPRTAPHQGTWVPRADVAAKVVRPGAVWRTAVHLAVRWSAALGRLRRDRRYAADAPATAR